MKDKDSILLENAYNTALINYKKNKTLEPVKESRVIINESVEEKEEEAPKKSIEQAYNEAIKDINNKKLISEENITLISSDKKIAKRLAHNLILLGRELPNPIKETML